MHWIWRCGERVPRAGWGKEEAAREGGATELRNVRELT